jgi:D-alanyl-lipoteichoic acid acyltransferase DltB (MBOAT superfamily)
LLFPTPEFAIFFSLVFVCSWLLRPKPVAWRIFLLVASYVFYAWWDPRFTLLLLVSTLLNQSAARLIERSPSERSRRGWLIAAMVGDLGILGFFKYYGFFVTSVAGGFDKLGLSMNPPLLQVILPVGISFFTFQAMSYVIDIYRRDGEPYPLLDFAVYLSFFPHLVAGPIVRARELLPQLQEKGDPRHINASLAFRLIFSGLFKKVVISSFLAQAIVDPVFGTPNQHSALETLFGIYGYAIQIYADFSGYTDIAIGCALLLGLRFPQNFDAPYTSQTIQEFWRRWHMTLSFWLRDYLYIPLGGNRGSEGRTQRNLFLTMVIGGLWHGAAWRFVIWGSIHGAAMCLERAWARRRAAVRAATGQPEPPPSVGWSIGRWLLTFNIVCFAWVFFRATDFSDAMDVLSRLTAFGASPLVKPMVVFVIVGMIAAQFVPTKSTDRVQVVFSRMAPVLQGLILGTGFLLVDALGPVGVAPFIYFQF